MRTIKHHVFNTTRAETAPGLTTGASALGFALCATLSPGAAQAFAVAVDIPDTVLGSLIININGPQYSLFRDEVPGLFFENTISPTGTNGVVGFTAPPAPNPKTGTYAQALAANELIDGSRSFVSGPDIFLAGAAIKTPPYGEFYNTGGSAYAGLNFALPDGQHFGWIEMTGDNGTITVTRYGYECDPNVGIGAGVGSVSAVCAPQNVPEPVTLALLVAGAAGVLALRRRQRAHLA